MDEVLPLNKQGGKVQIKYAFGNEKFSGFINDGLKSGKCSEYFENGNLRYTGIFKSGYYHATNPEIYINGFDENYLPLWTNAEYGYTEGKVNGVGLKFNVNSNLSPLTTVSYINGQIDTTTANQPITHCFPNMLVKYTGEYKNNVKHGQGEIVFIPTETVLFKGEWKDNLPSRNAENSNPKKTDVVINSLVGHKHFEGSINYNESQNILEGYCKIYNYDTGTHLMYEGNYKAPNLTSIIFCTWDLILTEWQPYYPGF